MGSNVGMDVTTLTDDELKIAFYDELFKKETAENNLQQIGSELNRRRQEIVATEPEVDKNTES